MKERIIGAVVLVALVILVVPVFLDGPPDKDRVHTERVPLPGQDVEKTQTVVLERNRSEPVPVQASRAADAEPDGSGAPEAPAQDPVREESVRQAPVRDEPASDEAGQEQRAESATTDAPVPQRAAATPPRDATPEPASSPVTVQAASTGMFAVQLGSFSSKENAEKLAAELRKQGFAAFLSQLAAPGKQLHRVRVGPQKDRQAAESMAQRLAQAGHKGQVVPHP